MTDIKNPSDLSPRVNPIRERVKSTPVSSSAFLRKEDVSNIAAESLRAAMSVMSYARSADIRAVDIASQEVTEYSSTARSLSSRSSSSFFAQNTVNDPINTKGEPLGSGPSITRANVIFDRDSGVIDAFSVSVEYSVPDNLSGIVIMRRDDGVDRSVRKMSTSGLTKILSHESDYNARSIATDVLRISYENGTADDAVRSINPFLDRRRDDKYRDVRPFLEQTEIQKNMSVKALSGLVNQVTASRMDFSIVYDLNTIERLRSVFPTSSVPIPVRKREEIRDVSFQGEFKRVMTAGMTARSGSFIDHSVSRGKRYSYYVCGIQKDGRLTGRSAIVSVSVDKTVRSVPTPTLRSSLDGARATLSVISDDLAESAEFYRKIDSGEWQFLGKRPVSGRKTVFFDLPIVDGKKYAYRVYVIDCFGNKSQTPAECEITTKVIGQLDPLIVTADVDQLTGRAFLDIVVSNPDIRGIFIHRRDSSINERVYAAPSSPDVVSIGPMDEKRSQSVFSSDPSSKANGFIPIEKAGMHRYVDYSSRVDHSYQYSIFGVDAAGRKTSYSQTQNVFVSKRPLVSSPVNLSASVSNGSVELSWREPNLTFSVAEMIGNRDTLTATSVRNVYQLQRMDMKVGLWESFPLVDTTGTIDSEKFVSDGRPKPPEAGRAYLYRVATFQTGGYYSNYCDPIDVTIPTAVSAVGALSLSSGDPRVSPLHVNISWSAAGFDGTWLVERAQPANTVSSIGMSTAESSDFKVIATIPRESSRANSRELDNLRDPRLKNGANRLFVDTDVKLGQTYLYRVTAINGKVRSNSRMAAISLASDKVKTK